MKENYNLVKSCQDTAEQLRLRPGAGKPGKGAEANQRGQRPGCRAARQVPEARPARQPLAKRQA